MIVGSAVIVAYLVVLALNVRTATSGAEFSWQKIVSFSAASILVVQYLLGFSLLGEGRDVPAFHFLIGLAAILPVGMEHGYGSQQTSAVDRGKIGALANVMTLVVLVVAYIIGDAR
jgi:hypothetical protein